MMAPRTPPGECRRPDVHWDLTQFRSSSVRSCSEAVEHRLSSFKSILLSPSTSKRLNRSLHLSRKPQSEALDTLAESNLSQLAITILIPEVEDRDHEVLYQGAFFHGRLFYRVALLSKPLCRLKTKGHSDLLDHCNHVEHEGAEHKPYKPWLPDCRWKDA